MSWALDNIKITPDDQLPLQNRAATAINPNTLFQEIQESNEYQEDSFELTQRAQQAVRHSHFITASKILDSLIKGVVKA